MIRPLFPSDDSDQQEDTDKKSGYTLRHREGLTIQPLSKDLVPPSPVSHHHGKQRDGANSNPAVELIRSKLEALYYEEPSVKQEIASATKPQARHSKHQQFMYELSTSGKPLAQIHTEWHNYYVGLPDSEKHQVWREFYEMNARKPSSYERHIQQEAASKHTQDAPVYNSRVIAHTLPALPHHNRSSTERFKQRIVGRVRTSNEAQEKTKQHLRSLAFGLGTGLIVLFILLFGFFNERFLAPFIQPSRHVSATPIIVSSDSVAVSETPEILIPKINVQIPVVYNLASVDEGAIQKALEEGVIQYPTTSIPGQQGNAAFFGHSSNNIFNKGKYKFAFVLLHKLVPGDIFYVTYEKKIYTYRVFDKKIVAPDEVSVLNDLPDKTATAILITCDPPGTSTNRLVVWGEQISPDPSGAIAPTTSTAPETPAELPSEGPSFWSRLWQWDL